MIQVVHHVADTHVENAPSIEVPARFVGDRVYVRLETANGGELTLYTDTGGGSLIVTRAAAMRLHLPTDPIDDPEARAELGPDAAMTVPPKLARRLPPLPSRAFVVLHASQVPGWPEQADGFVGAQWFGRGVWTWDYASGHLSYRSSISAAHCQSIPLGFKTDERRDRPTSFARIAVELGGSELQMLLDTGAETLLTDASRSAIADGGPKFRATSMLEATEFDAVHRLHPDWPFIEHGQVGTNAAMLRVPAVTIGHVKTGPVWFTRRPDSAYKNFMSSMMDQPVVGSIGGNAFHGLVLTIDYQGARAWLNQPGTGCFAPTHRNEQARGSH